MISSKNIFYHELIGLEVKIVDSTDSYLIGLKGTIVDETKKTFLIQTNSSFKREGGKQSNSSFKGKREKLIQKDISVFQFKVPDGTIVEIDGKILLNRPEDRIKKRYKKI
ncbi:MAG: ribonuclease P protein component 1 [Methanobacteriaceae archaeon]|nr:ribonuclease P protein component 1 [Methanobacteriaceae archaeon]